MSAVVSSASEEMESWKIDCQDRLVVKQNREELIFTAQFMTIIVLLTILGAISFLFDSPDDPEVIYILAIIEKYFPGWKNGLTKICECPIFIFVSCTTAISPGHFIFYTLLQFTMQKNVLLYHFKHINSGYEKMNTLDSSAQEAIKKKLLICLKLHINICR